MNSRLPLELYRPIIGYASAEVHWMIPPLIPICRFFQAEAETLLYSRIKIRSLWDALRFKLQLELAHPSLDGHASETAWQRYLITKYMSLLRTLRENQRLADLVHSFIAFHGWALDQDTSFWALFAQTLPRLRNLKELSLQVTAGKTAGLVLEKCLFQLTRLDWLCYNVEGRLASFLSHQTHLRQLAVEYHDRSGAIPNDCLQNLSVLYGSHAAIFAFLPGKWVKTLMWTPAPNDPALTPATLAAVSSALEQLETLICGGNFCFSYLAELAPHLQNLQHLQLIGIRPQDKHAITSVASLRHLKVSQLWNDGARGPTNHGLGRSILFVEDQTAYLEHLFSKLDELQIVDVESEPRKSFQRYCRTDGNGDPDKGVRTPTVMRRSIYEWMEDPWERLR